MPIIENLNRYKDYETQANPLNLNGLLCPRPIRNLYGWNIDRCYTINRRGGKVDMLKSASLSSDGRYRYSLTRIWDHSKPMVMFLMLNPSTADAEEDDPTIRRCIGFAKVWGYGGIYVGNLYVLRSKLPTDLLGEERPWGDANGLHLSNMAIRSDKIITAWGNSGIVDKLLKKYPDYKPMEYIKKPLHYLELSIDGTPKHPLYLKKTLIPVLWDITVKLL